MSFIPDQAGESINPFRMTSILNALLSLDVCQTIHYTALCRAVHYDSERGQPRNLLLQELKERAHWHGSSVYLFHPDDIKRIFRGVTLYVYQAIEQLYCSRLQLSISMVNRILNAMATDAETNSIDYEAVWAICQFLEARRTIATAITIIDTNATWWMGQQTLETEIRDRGGLPYRPKVVMVTDLNNPRLWAIQLMLRSDDIETPSLAIYNALTLQRQPAAVPEGTFGLSWHLPTKLLIDMDLPSDCLRACTLLGINVERRSEQPEFLTTLISNWTQDFKNRQLTTTRFVHVFDTYVYRVLGSSPIRLRDERERRFADLIGYNRDATWQLSALRLLLPVKTGTISDQGTILCDGLTYYHALLRFWLGSPVTIRQSVDTESIAWVYLDGEILCLARAQELRRHDGTYRSWR